MRERDLVLVPQRQRERGREYCFCFLMPKSKRERERERERIVDGIVPLPSCTGYTTTLLRYFPYLCRKRAITVQRCSFYKQNNTLPSVRTLSICSFWCSARVQSMLPVKSKNLPTFSRIRSGIITGVRFIRLNFLQPNMVLLHLSRADRFFFWQQQRKLRWSLFFRSIRSILEAAEYFFQKT